MEEKEIGKHSREKLLGPTPERIQRSKDKKLEDELNAKHTARAVSECNWEEFIQGRELTKAETDEIAAKHLENYKKELDEIRRKTK